MAGFLIPALIGAAGSLVKGLVNRNKNNTNSQYQTDQARATYEANRLAAQEQDQRKLDGIDYLEAIAQGKGYNIPTSAFEALKRRGAYAGTPANQAILDAPKQGVGSAIFGAIGDGITGYAGMTGQAEMDRVLKNNAVTAGLSPSANSIAVLRGSRAGSTDSPVAPTGVGDSPDDFLAYYKSLLGNDQDEISVGSR